MSCHDALANLSDYDILEYEGKEIPRRGYGENWSVAKNRTETLGYRRAKLKRIDD
jgi:hypothetical protein